MERLHPLSAGLARGWGSEVGAALGICVSLGTTAFVGLGHQHCPWSLVGTLNDPECCSAPMPHVLFLLSVERTALLPGWKSPFFSPESTENWSWAVPGLPWAPCLLPLAEWGTPGLLGCPFPSWPARGDHPSPGAYLGAAGWSRCRGCPLGLLTGVG